LNGHWLNKSKGKIFFFEKKKQKTFACWHTWPKSWGRVCRTGQSAARRSQKATDIVGAASAAVSGPTVNTLASELRTWFGTAADPALPGVRPGTTTSLALMVVK
jgi:hypothetical protein